MFRQFPKAIWTCQWFPFLFCLSSICIIQISHYSIIWWNDIKCKLPTRYFICVNFPFYCKYFYRGKGIVLINHITNWLTKFVILNLIPRIGLYQYMFLVEPYCGCIAFIRNTRLTNLCCEILFVRLLLIFILFKEKLYSFYSITIILFLGPCMVHM